LRGWRKTLSKYLLFSGDHYYPNGGFSDYQGVFDSVEDAKEHLVMMASSDNSWKTDWAQIVKLAGEDFELVCEYFDGNWYPND